MGAKMKGVLSKRRPRQNIIATILKNAKTKGSSSPSGGASASAARGGSTSFVSASTESSASKQAPRGSSRRRSRTGYHGSKKGILQSAVELTRRSKRAGSRTRRGKSRGRSGRSVAFVKGQRAFYRSPKGIAKVTVVGIHHDAKLEAYYTIRMRDGKEKQTDGKRLTPVQEDARIVSSSKRGSSDGSVSVSGGASVGGSVSGSVTGSVEESSKPLRSSMGTSPDVPTDNMTESSSEVEIIIEEVDDEDDDNGGNDENKVWAGNGRRSKGGGVDDEYGLETSDNEEEEDAKKFEVDQDAYYRSPDGSIAKVRVLSYGEDPNHPHRYAISLPDGSRKDGVRPSRLATLMDLTSKELSMLMKERNRKQQQGNRGRSRTTRGRRLAQSEPPARNEDREGVNDAGADVDEGYLAAGEGGPASTGSEQILSRCRPSSDAAVTDNLDGGLDTKQEVPLLALPRSTTVQMVEARTEEGGTKWVPMYEAGRVVQYKNAAGIQPATILDVHLDDLLEPYYSIRLEDGREKQTDNAHILVLESEEEEGDEKWEDAKEEVGEVVSSQPATEEEVTHEGVEAPVTKKLSSSLRNSLQNSLRSSTSSHQHVPDIASSITSHKKPVNIDGSDRSQDVSLTRKRDATIGSVASSAAPAPPITFTAGDTVLYNSSQGEQLRAVVLRLHHDKKNRPYYVIRLETAKEKQVYGHRLRPYERRDRDDLRRSRSRSRAQGERGQSRARGRSSSKGGRYGRSRSKKPQDLRRSESIESHHSNRSGVSAASLSNSSRRSRASCERAERAEREGSVTSFAQITPSRGRRHRDELASSSVRDGRARGKARSPSLKASSRGRSRSTVRRSRSRVGSGGRGESAQSDRRHGRPSGRERSRSRAPSEVSTSLRSSSHQHQFSSSHHHHSISNSRSSRLARSTPVAAGGGDHGSLLSGSVGEGMEGSKGRSISRLKNFRKSFAGRKKKH